MLGMPWGRSTGGDILRFPGSADELDTEVDIKFVQK